MIHVTVTCPDAETARALARAGVAARLAACAHVAPPLDSLFHWQGAVAEETETAVTFKTTGARRAALVALIVARHPYDLPVITWSAVETTPGAAAWLEAETGG